MQTGFCRFSPYWQFCLTKYSYMSVMYTEYLSFFFPMALRPNADLGLLILEVSRSHRHNTVGRTPLDEWSARRRDLYLTAQNTHNRQISMPPVGFEPTISAGERSQTYALDRAATGTGGILVLTVAKFIRTSIFFFFFRTRKVAHLPHPYMSDNVLK